MKVYFDAAIRGKDVHENYYRTIHQTIESLGHKISNKYLLESSVENHYKQLEKGGDNAYEDFYDQTLADIKSSDINVFECSVPSLGIGYQVEKSLTFNKPTIVLYLKDKIPHFLAGIKDDKLVIKSVDIKNVKKILKDAFEEAKQRADKRFNFFLSPRLLEYLEGASKKEGVTKSKLIRDMIIQHMRENTEE